VTFLIFRWALGGILGMIALRLHDEGWWSDALMKGAMSPSPTPEARARFFLICTLLPELPLAAFLAMFLHRD
jgi:hypothetical protein